MPSGVSSAIHVSQSFRIRDSSRQSGAVYAVEFETWETPESLRGFVNAKGQVSDERPGFNPYRKQEDDGYEEGMAYREGAETNCDLDVQIIEYTAARVKE